MTLSFWFAHSQWDSANTHAKCVLFIRDINNPEMKQGNNGDINEKKGHICNDRSAQNTDNKRELALEFISANLFIGKGGQCKLAGANRIKQIQCVLMDDGDNLLLRTLATIIYSVAYTYDGTDDGNMEQWPRMTQRNRNESRMLCGRWNQWLPSEWNPGIQTERRKSLICSFHLSD